MESMSSRANTFLIDYILPLISSPSGNEQVVAVVAHGVILQVLWVCLTELFDARNIHMGPGLIQGDLTDYVHLRRRLCVIPPFLFPSQACSRLSRPQALLFRSLTGV